MAVNCPELSHWHKRNGYCYAVWNRMGRPLWTREEWRTLERLRLGGVPWEQVAKRLGRSPNACRVAWCKRGPSGEYLRMVGLLWAVCRDPSIIRSGWRHLRGASGELEEVGRRVLRI